MVGAESMPVTLTTEKDSLSRVAWMMTRSPESVLEGVEPWLWMLEAESVSYTHLTLPTILLV